ncbi:tetratricopeptide repeat protein [Thalassotalea psychrophila]|uniref:Tetratricopeptide repeat protein n=1 Tax=Thalassotalea psychrophila TaxID=3065647 RepID=A0ABY9TZ19_9GAMM|nr:tetratricopeptide repeat protein [Colwelliaceae bacterium SQ149]
MVNIQQTRHFQGATDKPKVTLAGTLTKLRAKRKQIFTAVILVLSISIYLQPQSFINLWLTRDQQAKIYFERGEFEKAALTFASQKWVAHSYYLNGNFEQAASVYAQFDDVDSIFSKANANAHKGKFELAIEQFEQVLKLQEDHAGAMNNMALLQKIMKSMTKKPSASDDELSNENQVLRKQKGDIEDKKDEPKAKSVSDELWLEQVQKNPGKFLQKKFQQEHINASK